MQHHRTASAFALAGLLALGTGSTALAAGDESSGNSGTATEQAPISDQKLEQFTTAMADVREIRMDYGSQLQQAESQDKRQKLKQEGQQEMLEAIRDSGLKVEEYNRIGNRLGNDKELQQRLKKMMSEQSG